MNRIQTREADEAAGWVIRPVLCDTGVLIARQTWLGIHGCGHVLVQEAKLRWSGVRAAPEDYVVGLDLVARRVADGASFSLTPPPAP